MKSVVTRSGDETAALGEKLATLLGPGDFIALFGDLGAGKTRFTQGLAAGLLVDRTVPVTSPTYSILHIHNGRLQLYHFDLYRLRGDEDIELLGFAEYFYGQGVTVVEWADRLQGELPEEHLAIRFDLLGDDLRKIELVPHGKRYDMLVMNLFP